MVGQAACLTGLEAVHESDRSWQRTVRSGPVSPEVTHGSHIGDTLGEDACQPGCTSAPHAASSPPHGAHGRIKEKGSEMVELREHLIKMKTQAKASEVMGLHGIWPELCHHPGTAKHAF